MISAPVPIITPSTEINEMMLMARCDFFERKYRFAMKSGSFIGRKDGNCFSNVRCE